LSAGQYVLHRPCQIDEWHGIKVGIEVSINLPSSKEDRRQLRLATSRGPIEDIVWSSLRDVKENKKDGDLSESSGEM
jgi:hypothetical protein